MNDVLLKSGFFFLLILAVTKPLGIYMKRVFSGEKTFLDPVLLPFEKLLYRLGGVGPLKDQTWLTYAGRC